MEDKIATILDPEEACACFSMMFTRELITSRPYVSNTRTISNNAVDEMIGK